VIIWTGEAQAVVIIWTGEAQAAVIIWTGEAQAAVIIWTGENCTVDRDGIDYLTLSDYLDRADMSSRDNLKW
jgi:hypothetical protein